MLIRVRIKSKLKAQNEWWQMACYEKHYTASSGFKALPSCFFHCKCDVFYVSEAGLSPTLCSSLAPMFPEEARGLFFTVLQSRLATISPHCFPHAGFCLGVKFLWETNCSNPWTLFPHLHITTQGAHSLSSVGSTLASWCLNARDSALTTGTPSF